MSPEFLAAALPVAGLAGGAVRWLFWRYDAALARMDARCSALEARIQTLEAERVALASENATLRTALDAVTRERDGLLAEALVLRRRLLAVPFPFGSSE